MAKNKTQFVCQECGYISLKWMGKCQECNSWSSFVEEIPMETIKAQSKSLSISEGAKPQKISDIEFSEESRISTNISELDIVLGGGIVGGSLVLVGGDPGIGKSTLLIQMANNLGNNNKKVLYVSGEESVKQTKLRASRIGIASDNLYVLSENDINKIMVSVENLKPDILIVDSIQTVYRGDITSAPGSVSQVREATSLLMKVSKGLGISTFIIGHVTKSGNIAGPKVLEHMVDTVLYFEGENYNTYRILRSVKNRFGSTNEIGVFEMTHGGLSSVSNPSNIFLSERSTTNAGSVVTATLEGTRPVLCEIQALVSQTNFGMPRRMAVGSDYNKMVMLMAVLEKKLGYALMDQDGYVNVVGGMNLSEPASDLCIVSAIASSFKNRVVTGETIIFGEVGLTGEIRMVNQPQIRINEGIKMGFKTFIIPKGNLEGLDIPKDINVHGVNSIRDAFDIMFE